MNERNDLKPEYMIQEEAAKYLNVTPRSIAAMRKGGILRFLKAGKRFVYKKAWLDECVEKYAGYDISNPDSIALAVNSIKWREEHEPKGKRN